MLKALNIILILAIVSTIGCSEGSQDFPKRQLSLTSMFENSPQAKKAKEMGKKMPKVMCKPVHEAGKFIIDTALKCGVELLKLKSGKLSKVVGKLLDFGKKVTKKLGLMDV